MNSKSRRLLLFLLVVFPGIILDQYTKYLAMRHLKGADPFPLWDEILLLFYSENRGAAFGILQGKMIFFYIVTLLVGGGILFVLYKMPLERRYNALFASLSVTFAGAIGNFIDRVRLGYVVDFIYFKPIDFPIFNIADIFVSLSAFSLLVLFLFYYKDEEFFFLNRKAG